MSTQFIRLPGESALRYLDVILPWSLWNFFHSDIWKRHDIYICIYQKDMIYICIKSPKYGLNTSDALFIQWEALSGLNEFPFYSKRVWCWNHTWSSLFVSTWSNFLSLPHKPEGARRTHNISLNETTGDPCTKHHSRTWETFSILPQAIAVVLDGEKEYTVCRTGSPLSEVDLTLKSKHGKHENTYKRHQN